MRVIYYLDVLSSWCWLAEDAWVALGQACGGRAVLEWQVALLDGAEGLPYQNQEQMLWYYRRSGFVTGRAPLHAGWLDRPGVRSVELNLVAEAARALGRGGDAVRLALARALLVEGRPIHRLPEAVAVAAPVAGLPPELLLAEAVKPATRAAVEASTAAWRRLGVSERPTFVFESAIGDRAVLSGVWRPEPLLAVARSFLEDARLYAEYGAQAAPPPF